MNPSFYCLSDYPVEDLPQEPNVVVVCSTCGQGEFPANAKDFWSYISNPALPNSWLSHTNYTVFGLGDSNYCEHFCEAAKKFDKRLAELGATQAKDIGTGDDQHPDGFEGGIDEWLPNIWTIYGNPEPSRDEPLPPPSNSVQVFQPESECFHLSNCSARELFDSFDNQMLPHSS